MEVRATKLVDSSWLLQRACEMTLHAGKKSNVSLDRMYSCEHSPIRTQLFWIEMLGIPTFVSVHLTRHSIGVTHFVESNRSDRGTAFVADRTTPVNHGMLINAQALINMSRKRLCRCASKETIQVMKAIKEAILPLDLDLWKHMNEECIYRNGCFELKGCGFYEQYTRHKEDGGGVS